LALRVASSDEALKLTCACPRDFGASLRLWVEIGDAHIRNRTCAFSLALGDLKLDEEIALLLAGHGFNGRD
jgi:hypothetical protein